MVAKAVTNRILVHSRWKSLRVLSFLQLVLCLPAVSEFADDVPDSTSGAETCLLQMSFSLQGGEREHHVLDNRRTNSSSQRAEHVVLGRRLEELQVVGSLVGRHEHAAIGQRYTQIFVRCIVLAFVAYVLLREVCPVSAVTAERSDEGAGSIAKQQSATSVTPQVDRSAHFDNAKFLALTLVIYAHWCGARDFKLPNGDTLNQLPFTNVIYKAVWFHMPLFLHVVWGGVYSTTYERSAWSLCCLNSGTIDYVLSRAFPTGQRS